MAENDKPKIVVQPQVIADLATQPQSVKLVAMGMMRQVLVRTGRVYLQSLVGFLTTVLTGAGGTLINVPPGEFGAALVAAMKLSLAPAVLTFVQNLLELVSGLDTKKPEMRA